MIEELSTNYSYSQDIFPTGGPQFEISMTLPSGSRKKICRKETSPAMGKSSKKNTPYRSRVSLTASRSPLVKATWSHLGKAALTPATLSRRDCLLAWGNRDATMCRQSPCPWSQNPSASKGGRGTTRKPSNST